MVNARRGQAAMEYLMTYGWALLVIVLVLGALIYLQVLNPQSRLQDTCSLQVGWKCEVASLDDQGTLGLKITNQQAVQLSTSIYCNSGTGHVITGDEDYKPDSPVSLSPGQSDVFYCTVPDFTNRQIGDSTSGEVVVKYKDGTVDKYLKGTYTAKVSTLANAGP